MRLRWNVEQRSGHKVNHAIFTHRRNSMTRDYESHMFDSAELRASNWRHVLRPLPTRFVCGSTDCHSADMDNLDLASLKTSPFTPSFEALKHYVIHDLRLHRRISTPWHRGSPRLLHVTLLL